MDATDYLNTSEARRQILSAKEEMMYDLTDEYLGSLELEEQEQRRAESGWPEHAEWGIEIDDENEQ